MFDRTISTNPLSFPFCQRGKEGDLRKIGVPFEVAQNSALYSLETTSGVFPAKAVREAKNIWEAIGSAFFSAMTSDRKSFHKQWLSWLWQPRFRPDSSWNSSTSPSARRHTKRQAIRCLPAHWSDSQS